MLCRVIISFRAHQGTSFGPVLEQLVDAPLVTDQDATFCLCSVVDLGRGGSRLLSYGRLALPCGCAPQEQHVWIVTFCTGNESSGYVYFRDGDGKGGGEVFGARTMG